MYEFYDSLGEYMAQAVNSETDDLALRRDVENVGKLEII